MNLSEDECLPMLLYETSTPQTHCSSMQQTPPRGAVAGYDGGAIHWKQLQFCSSSGWALPDGLACTVAQGKGILSFHQDSSLVLLLQVRVCGHVGVHVVSRRCMFLRPPFCGWRTCLCRLIGL